MGDIEVVKQVVFEVMKDNGYTLYVDTIAPDGTLLAKCGGIVTDGSKFVYPYFVIGIDNVGIVVPSVIQNVINNSNEMSRTVSGLNVLDLINDINFNYVYGSAYLSDKDEISYHLTIPNNFLTTEAIEWAFEMTLSMCDTIHRVYHNSLS